MIDGRKEGLRKVLAEMEQSSRKVLAAAVRCADNPTPLLAALHSDAERRAQVLGARTPSGKADPELAKVYRESVQRYARASQLFLETWIAQTVQILDEKHEKSCGDPDFAKKSVARWQSSEQGDPDRAEHIEDRIVLTKATLAYHKGDDAPPEVTAGARAMLEMVRREHRESVDAGGHPHVLLLQEMLVEVLRSILHKGAN